MKEDKRKLMATAPINSEAIELSKPEAELKLVRSPEKVLDDAHKAAQALQHFIDNSAIQPVQFGSKKHLLHEHWGMLGHFFGYCTKLESVRFVEYPDNIRGFEATTVLINERNGAEVGRATALCLDEEEQWGEVAEYEWQDVLDGQGNKIYDRGSKRYLREKVQVGTKNKPLFQLQSMAETRASAKCYRLKLSWVAVLAGYSPTPAEEMRREDEHDQHDTPMVSADNIARKYPDELPTELRRKDPGTAKPITPSYEQRRVPPRPQAQPVQQQAPARPASNGGVISEPQARRFYAIWKDNGKTKAMVTEYLRETFGIADDRQIPASRYKEACAWAEGEF